jgi:dTDP-glucose 4,6-dehydratase
MNNTILITGGAGFIGRSFVEHILDKTNWNIVVLDSLSYAGDINYLATNGKYDPNRVRIVWHDLRAPINEYLQTRIGPVRWIVNIASESHVDRSITSPADFFMTNCAIAANTLEYARIVKPESFIQVSTDEVYGPAAALEQHKEWDTHVPSNPYSASKSAQEALAVSYWRTFNVPVIITNTMNNFGPSQHIEKFIPMCVSKILNNEPITIHGKYENGDFISGSRFWLHANNHADALLFILQNCPAEQYPATNRPSKWHIAGDQEVSNLQIANKIAEILGKTAIIKPTDFHSSRPGHDLRYALDGSKIKGAGWVPPVNFENSLVQTVNWFSTKFN